MSIFGDKTDEERTELAKLLKVEATKLEDMTLVDVFGQLQKMDEAERTAFEKAFVPIPALPAGDLSAVMSGLMRIDEVSALFKLFAETLGVDALRKEIADLKAVQAPAPATAPSAEVAAVPAETAAEGVEESDKPKPEAGAEVSAETAEVAAATGGADDVRTVVQDEIKKAMGTQGLTSEDSGAQPTGQRAEVEKMLGDGMNPADVMTAAFKP